MVTQLMKQRAQGQVMKLLRRQTHEFPCEHGQRHDVHRLRGKSLPGIGGRLRVHKREHHRLLTQEIDHRGGHLVGLLHTFRPAVTHHRHHDRAVLGGRAVIHRRILQRFMVIHHLLDVNGLLPAQGFLIFRDHSCQLAGRIGAQM